jgi:hypothetical protein
MPHFSVLGGEGRQSHTEREASDANQIADSRCSRLRDALGTFLNVALKQDKANKVTETEGANYEGARDVARGNGEHKACSLQ